MSASSMETCRKSIANLQKVDNGLLTSKFSGIEWPISMAQKSELLPKSLVVVVVKVGGQNPTSPPRGVPWG